MSYDQRGYLPTRILNPAILLHSGQLSTEAFDPATAVGIRYE